MTNLIQHWLTDSANRFADQPAINFRHEILTYTDLEARTNQLAELLRESGCQRGDRIAFCLPKSPAAIIAMLGTLKADCVYVPIDPDCPSARIAKVLESCRPRWILAGNTTAKLIDEVFTDRELTRGLRVGSLDAESIDAEHFNCEFHFNDLDQFSTAQHSYQNTGSDAAHILFTSGSTGVPKGVVITHEMVRAFVEWAVDYFQIDSNDRVSGHAPLHFDLSTFDIYGAFAAGAELYPVTPQLNLLPGKLVDFIRSNELTQWFSVPSILNYLAKFDAVEYGDFESLKRLMWCGEVLPTPTLCYFMRRLPTVEFTNLYGPTEATIASSYYTVPALLENETDSIPIGVPCGGEDLLVLDDQLDTVPTGDIGDLYISGVGLSPGYWCDQEKTDSVFHTHPKTGNRIYRTGDLARVNADGLIDFVGRADTQIKSRGYRIELGEIETGLATLNSLKESAVVAIDTDGFENKLICCAWVSAGDEQVCIRQIRSQLSEHVPKYMIPTNWLEFDCLPKNANGKIDRPELRRRFEEEHASAQAPIARDKTTPTATETKLISH